MSRSFHWQTDPTPNWFSAEKSYRMDIDTKQIEVPTKKGNVLVNPGELITEDQGGFFLIGEPKLNREQRRKSHKNDNRMILTAITLTFADGQTVNLDIHKVAIVDKETKANLFSEVLDAKESK